MCDDSGLKVYFVDFKFLGFPQDNKTRWLNLNLQVQNSHGVVRQYFFKTS